MKRVITIKGNDGDITVDIKATIKASNYTRGETETLVSSLANSLFKSVETLPYNTRFGVHNTKVSL